MPKKPSSTDATSTLTTTWLVKRLATDYPAIDWQESDSDCAWLPSDKRITYSASTSPQELLHELGHALCEHQDYSRDIVLLRMERDAWSEAERLAPIYGVILTSDTIETALDSYREWLHRRSTCPSCGLSGMQVGAKEYRCVSCEARWEVNEARTCRLRRLSLR